MDSVAYAYDEEWRTLPAWPVGPPLVTRPSPKAFYAPRQPDYVDSFHRHLLAWRKATSMMSTFDRILSHPDFLAITRMGRKALPLVFNELRDRPDFLYMALPVLAPESEVDNANYQSPELAINAWLVWADQNGYR